MNQHLKNYRTSRLGNIELLRIISMLLIITSHFWGHGIDLASIEPFTFLYYFGWFVKGVSYVSVNIYVLISAYFLYGTKFRSSKLISLWLEVEFYSISLFLIGILTNSVDFSIQSFLSAIFPVCGGEYWFVTVYVGLYLLHPVLDLCIRNMNKRQLGISILILEILFVVIPNLFFYSKWLNFGMGYGIVWFVVLYYIGSYIKLFVSKDTLKNNKKTITVYSIIFLMLPGLSRIVIACITNMLLGRVIGAGLFFSNNSIIILPATILFFLMFLSFEIKSINLTRIINGLAANSLAVYLIHDNSNISSKLWSSIVEQLHPENIFIIVEFVFVIISIYLCCALIDEIRKRLFIKDINIKILKSIDLVVNEVFYTE